jgi:PAS domain S-box-containing protein
MAEAPQPPSTPVNVLLVDDQPANLLALEAVLDGPGVHLVKAASGEEALRRLLADDFAVVLLDVQMHGLDGFATAKHIRAGEKSRHTPIIFLTAYESSEFSAEQAYSLGAVDYLVKPLVPVILRAKVAGFVELFLKTEQVKRQGERLHELERGERRRAEERLRESEARFRGVVESNMIGIGFWQRDGQITDANEALLRMIGYARDDLTACRVSWMDLTPPEYWPLDQRALAEIAARGACTPFEKEYLREDGSRFPVLVGGAHFEGSPDHGAFFVLDVTERKRAEEALREADRRKDEFLAMLAHELRNPLAPIRNALHLLKQTGLEDAVRQEVRGMMERQVQHLSRLVDDLLDISRITRGKIQLRKERLDVAAVVQRAVETCRPAVEERRHNLIVSLPPEPPGLEVDPARLEQVLSNLLDNAAKYTPEGGRIEVTAAREGGEVVLRVRDTGVGIRPDMLARIFDLFVQSERVLEDARGGLGIGLALVRSLVAMHGGSVAAHSDGPGRGSEFVVRLPALAEGREQAPAPPAAPAAPVAAGPTRRVLVVDDSADAAESLALILRLGGHEVRVAHDGPAALAAVLDARPEVVFLDLGMPGMDGCEVARHLRLQPGLEGVTLVALTGWGQAEDRRRTREAGFDHHLVKPVDPAALNALLTGPVPPGR